jgi:hypothetical protein
MLGNDMNNEAAQQLADPTGARGCSFGFHGFLLALSWNLWRWV